MLSPRQIFEDNIRPADLLLKVFRLLEHDAPNTESELHRALRDHGTTRASDGLSAYPGGMTREGRSVRRVPRPVT